MRRWPAGAAAAKYQLGSPGGATVLLRSHAAVQQWQPAHVRSASSGDSRLSFADDSFTA